MKKQHFTKVLAGLILVTLASSCKKGSLKTNADPPLPKGHFAALNSTSAYWNFAQQTHSFVVGNILTTYNSYKVNTTTNSCYEWYNASQIYADAAFVSVGDSRYASYMNNTYTWMGNMWNSGSSNGGYFSSANVDGSGPGGDQYVDDNSLTGITYLDAYAVTTGTTQTNYLNSAKAIANFLMNNGQWDTTYGGGFWWHTGTKDLKPTQTNGLAMQLFLRLYKITGQTTYRDWANSVKTWLETTMYDNATNLYIWEITGTGTGTRMTTEFTYDNAIMIEADLLYASVMNDNSYLAKAQTLGAGMHATLWNSTYHAFIFNTADARINPAWCVWGSQAMIKLYEADNNVNWLGYAQQNIDAINSVDRDPVSHGYYYFAGLDGSGKTTTDFEGVDQAWMQRTQAMLSKYK